MTIKKSFCFLSLAFFVASGAALMVQPAAGSIPPTLDHLKCYKIKDPIKLKGVVNILAQQFPPELECKIRKAVEFCVPAHKEVLEAFDGKEPIEPNPEPGPLAAGDYICYKIKCDKDQAPPDQLVGDQFGERPLSKFKAVKLCTPAEKVVLPPP